MKTQIEHFSTMFTIGIGLNRYLYGRYMTSLHLQLAECAHGSKEYAAIRKEIRLLEKIGQAYGLQSVRYIPIEDLNQSLLKSCEKIPELKSQLEGVFSQYSNAAEGNKKCTI